MACASTEDNLAFIATALSSLTDKEIVTNNVYRQRQRQALLGLATGYIFRGEVNVIREIEQSYANMYYQDLHSVTIEKKIKPYCYDIYEEDAMYRDQSPQNYYSDPEDCTLGSYSESNRKKMRIFNRRKTYLLKQKSEKVNKSPTDESIPITEKENYIPSKQMKKEITAGKVLSVTAGEVITAGKVSSAQQPFDQARKPKNQLLNALFDYFQDCSKIEEIKTTKQLLYNEKRNFPGTATKKEESVTQDKVSDTQALKHEWIQLFVLSSLSGEIICLRMPSKENSINQLKVRIQEKLGIKIEDQSLYFQGKVLEDTHTIESSRITDNATVTLFHKLRGGSRDLYYIDPKYLDPSWDYDFTNISDGNTQFKRGGYPYYRPCGWKRIAIKVSGKYQNDKWLGHAGDGSNGEWAVTYHGTKSNVFNKIANEDYIIGDGAVYGRGVYSSPNIDTAATARSTPFNFEGMNYIAVFQNRVNPNGVNIVNNGNYWVCPDKENIRPYGLCVKRIN